MAQLQYQAVLLAGGTGRRLYPLNSGGTPKALLPVGNQPLISFPIKLLEHGGVTDVIVVCYGDTAGSKVSGWLKSYQGPLHTEVVTVREECGTADALREIKSKLKTEHIIVLSGDLITDVPLKALVLSHFVGNNSTTVLLAPRRVSPSSETKPGKAPKNVDYVGLDQAQQRLLFFQASPGAMRELKLPRAALQSDGGLTLRTDYAEQGLYIFQRALLLAALDAKPAISGIKEDLLPYLLRHQLASGSSLTRASSVSSSGGAAGPPKRQGSMAYFADPLLTDRSSGGAADEAAQGEERCGVYLAGPGQYCMRTNTLQAYGDANRDIAAPELASRLLDLKMSPKYENVIHDTVQLGSKTTIAAGCIIGRGTLVGDKCSVKRSVVGAMVKLGSNVKVLNSVIMDGAAVEDNCHIQNSIVCNLAHVEARCVLRDCHIGPNYRLTEGSEHRDEVLANTKVEGSAL